MAHERGQSEQNALNKAFSDPAQSFNTVMKGFDGANYPALSVEADGSLNVNAALGDLTLDTVPYGITYGPLTDSGYFYLAYQDGTGAWYMKRKDTTTTQWQYVKGTSDIATNWANRASLTWTDYDGQDGIETAVGVVSTDVASNGKHLATEATLEEINQKINPDASGITDSVAKQLEDIKGFISSADTRLSQIEGKQDTQIAQIDGVKEARTQTPTQADALNVQIGPGDPISNIPVVMEFEHHQVHEGETYRIVRASTGLGTGTIKFAIDVPTGVYPHFIFGASVYGGAVKISIYKDATYTGGSALTAYNRNRNSANTPGTTAKYSVTSTDGDLIDAFYAGSGTKASGDGRARTEWILAPGHTYRVDMVGQAAGTDAIIELDWYEDLGV